DHLPLEVEGLFLLLLDLGPRDRHVLGRGGGHGLVEGLVLGELPLEGGFLAEARPHHDGGEQQGKEGTARQHVYSSGSAVPDKKSACTPCANSLFVLIRAGKTRRAGKTGCRCRC